MQVGQPKYNDRPPKIWDFLGWASALLFLSLVVAVALKRDLLSHHDLPESAWALYAIGIGGPVVFVLAVFSVMRLATKGWLRCWINHSPLYAPLTLGLYWTTAAVLTFSLAMIIAAGEFSAPTGEFEKRAFQFLIGEGRKITWAKDPTAFSILVLMVFLVVVFLLIGGVRKFASRRKAKELL